MDGSIRIGTKIDFSGLKKDLKEIESELNRVRKEQSKVDAQADAVHEKYREERDFDSQFPEELSHREDIDRRAAEELDPIIKKQDELISKEQELISLKEHLVSKIAEQNSLSQAGDALNTAIKGDNFASKITTQEQYNSLLEETRAKMASIEAHAERIASEMGVNKDNLLAQNAEYTKLADRLNILTTRTFEFKQEASAAGKTAEKSMKSARKSTDKLGNSIKSAIKKTGKMALAMLGVRGAFMAIRKAMTSYMDSNKELKNQLESLWNIAGQAIGPFVEMMVKGISTVIVWVNSLIKALTGIDLVAKANAAAIKKQAEAAKSLAGFDEQNKLSNDTETKGLFDPSMAYDVPAFLESIKNKILDGDWFGAGEELGKAIMDGIESLDWGRIGDVAGQIIGGAVSFTLGFAVKFDPNAIIEAVTTMAISLFNSLRQAIQKLNWFEIGKTIADLCIWGLVMTNPSSAIIAVLLSPNGEELSASAFEFAGAVVGALLQAIVGYVFEIGTIGKTIWDAVKNSLDENVDWSGSPGEIIDGLFAGIVDCLEDVGQWADDNMWKPFKKGFEDSIDWDGTGGQIISGLYEGIKEKIKNIGTWVNENIWIPFRDAFKKAFDIHSPSRKMKDFGGDIIDGLYEGIVGGISKIKTACETIWTTIKSAFSSVGSWFKTTFTTAWQNVKDVFSKGGTIFSGITAGISSTFKTIVNGLIDGINTVIRTPFNAINGMLNKIRDISIAGVKPFASLWSANPISVPQIPKLATGGIVNRPGRGVPAIIGEAGAEAVLPLENNTEWMDILADKIGGNVTIPIYMDGKKIATYVVDIQKKKAFALNGV